MNISTLLNLHLKKGFLAVNLISLFLFLFLILPKESFAVTRQLGAPPSGPNYSQVAASNCGVAADQCANTDQTSSSNSACGLNGCDIGLTWTKYNITCLYNSQIEDYQAWYQELGDRVYSIGDKCLAGETSLHLAYCNGAMGPQYKACCSGATRQACIQLGAPLDDGISPSEGSCPGNYVDCGGTGQPSCANACGATSTTAPTPTPTPTPVGDTCTNMTCTYSELDSSCASGVKITTGRGCTGFNCGCNFVSACSTSECT